MPHSEFMGWGDIDQAKAIAYERWLADHCPGCQQKRSDWLDENGVELRDPPFHLVEVLCPSCEWIGAHREEQGERQKNGEERQRHGIHLAFKRGHQDANDDES